MPTIAQILASVHEIANTWRTLAIAWHIYFGLLSAALVSGIRPSKRLAGVLLGLPLLSVSVMAWLSANPFNAIVFAVVGALFLFHSQRLPAEPVRIARPWAAAFGVLLFAFGWAYPHFLDTPSLWPYAYAAPVGLIPCPTLSIVIGAALVLDGLESRALSRLLGIMGLFYGVTGVAQLGVSIDAVLIAGALVTMIQASRRSPTDRRVTPALAPDQTGLASRAGRRS